MDLFLKPLIYGQLLLPVFLVMEYVSGGELFTHLCKRRFFPVESARILLGELALALKFIHSLNVVYRDLKLENILIEQHGHIKLTDFGLSKAYKEEMETTNSYCGTVEYMVSFKNLLVKNVGISGARSYQKNWIYKSVSIVLTIFFVKSISFWIC